MIRENKRQFAKYFLLFVYVYLVPVSTYTEEEQEFDIVNEVIDNIDSNDNIHQTDSDMTTEDVDVVTDEQLANSLDIQEKEEEQKILPTKIDYQERLNLQQEKRTIRNIYAQGNKFITYASILSKLPLKQGDIFDINYTSTMIKNLYKLGYFYQIKVYADKVGDDQVDIFITVEEKPRLKEVTFDGNKNLTAKELKDELKVETIQTLVKEELVSWISKIKKLYQKRNYHDVQVEAEIIPEKDDYISAHFNIKEGKKSYINRISFKGNKHISSKRLRRIIFSKEDWIMGMIDKSGTYNPEMIEGDKAMIEDAYRSNGFVNAKVTDVLTEQDAQSGDYHITYIIHEGHRYTIKSIEAPGNDVLSEDQLKLVIPIVPGQLYSVEKIRTAIENLRMLWGEHGYIFADIDPVIDIDEEDKTVTVKFLADLKHQVYLNRLTIKGNKKSRDKVIRRNIFLDEGELITNKKMETSKALVNLLNYFDPKDGVAWKTTRLDDTHADLELILKEVKTGSFNFNVGYGGSPTSRVSPQVGLNVNCSVADRNVFGTGIAASLTGNVSKRYRAFDASLMNPWLFDKPIKGLLSTFYRKSEYDEIDISENTPFESVIGGAAGLGYLSNKCNGILLEGKLTYERIRYDEELKPAARLGRDKALAGFILDTQFQPGDQVSLVYTMSQDKRNGVVFSTNGHQWFWLNQLTVPGCKALCESLLPNCGVDRDSSLHRFNYYRSELDISWYTPLIGEYDLVLCVHGNIGFVHRFKNKQIPWRTLYHVGGPTSVRGYLYGQVGPYWKGTSLGATKAFNVNIEFIAPLSSNLNTRAVVFYDGGAGWDTPYANEIQSFSPNFTNELHNNNFFYRHSVGIGVRMKSPSPMSIDFGIKLNPSKLFKKEITQLHFAMDHAF